MPRIFLPLREHSDKIRIEGEKARYLATVLRCKAGDELAIFDGRGTSLRTRITSVKKEEVNVEVVGVILNDTESTLKLILIQGLLKGEKMDLVIQKTTELGIGEIIPTITGRSQVRETRKIPRWRKIAEEAAEQSGRTAVPIIHEPVPFEDLFTRNSVYDKYRDINKLEALLKVSDDIYRLTNDLPGHLEEEGRDVEREEASEKSVQGFLFWEEGGVRLREGAGRIGTPISPFFIAVGPEGGFTKGEAELAESAGLTIASLGKRILRAETAAISGTVLIQFLWGDLS